ncbi:hypothetical protein F2Q70_00002548 [Brassica cretica]|uniref:Uncharacterized protein n=1 Tax=Brassica cretica TaxID=69181 RepID=A0A8S9J0M1_BRACR|nr:hypothetical protein F2Q70_00002548 [Brassica cretica]
MGFRSRVSDGESMREEVFRAGPTALYESWVQRVYTVTGCWWRLSSPEAVGAVCFKVWGTFLSGSSRRPEALSVTDSLLGGTPPLLRSGIWVSDLGSPAASPCDSGGFVLLGVCSRVTSGACDVGWVFSVAVLSDFVRDWFVSGGVALGFLSPHLIKLWGLDSGGRRLSTLSGSRSREEVFRAGPTALYESWVQRVYTVTRCWWRLSSLEAVGAMCFKIWGCLSLR